MPPGCIEFHVIEIIVVSNTGIKSEECIGVDAAFGVLLTVTRIKGNTTVQLWMDTAISLARTYESIVYIVVKERHRVGQIIGLVASELV